MRLVNMRELALGIYGAWQFVKLDRAAIQFFDNTEDAFRKSFSAALVVAPAYALLVLLGFIDRPPTAGEFRILAVESVAYVIGWVLFPLAMAYVVEMIDRSDRYFRFVAAWNWGIVLQVMLFVGVTSFNASGSLPPSLGNLVSLAATIGIFLYQGFIIHVTLDVRAGIAALIVGLDVLLSVLLNLVSRSMIYG